MNPSEYFLITVSESQNGQRLDRFLGEDPRIETRSRASKLIQNKCVFLNNRVIEKSSYCVTRGEVFRVNIPSVSPTELEPYPMHLTIYYEDSDLIFLEKPAGLVVHPSAGHTKETLVNALLHHTSDLSMGFNEQRPGIVHRLDKDTSGVLVVAKSDSVQKSLAEQFHEKTAKRRYHAIVFGHLKKENGVVESSLIRHPQDRKKYCSEKGADRDSRNGKWAITHYAVLATHPCGLSLLECRLGTGRTHQIRVHLSELGHPIVGDRVYGSTKRVKNLKSVKIRHMIEKMNRLGLHAFELGLIHPRLNKEMAFRSPWPQDLKNLVTTLGWEEGENGF